MQIYHGIYVCHWTVRCTHYAVYHCVNRRRKKACTHVAGRPIWPLHFIKKTLKWTFLKIHNLLNKKWASKLKFHLCPCEDVKARRGCMVKERNFEVEKKIWNVSFISFDLAFMFLGHFPAKVNIMYKRPLMTSQLHHLGCFLYREKTCRLTHVSKKTS